jgi:D-sedoheptulose 7-phosphate isomerase
MRMNEFDRFVTSYYDRLREAVTSLDHRALRPVLDELLALANRGGTLWIAGNGGSASIADHAACDLAKGTHVGAHPSLRAISLAANPAMLTAIANDIAFEQVYRRQLEIYLREGDAVLLVSASGESGNVVEACHYARERGFPTIAFVGFKGGTLKRLADHVVHVEVENYGIAEDVHQSVMHVLSQYIAFERTRAAGSPTIS